MSQPEPGQQPRASTGTTPGQQHPQIDVEALAERVYRLMMDELRLERARSGRPVRGRKG